MTFYKNLILVLGLCVLWNSAAAAAAADADVGDAADDMVETKLKRVTSEGLVDISPEKQAELRDILVRARAGDPGICYIHGIEKELDELCDTPEAPIRGGLEDSIVTDNPVVLWGNKVTIRRIMRLRPGERPNCFIGGFVGKIHAPTIILGENAFCLPGGEVVIEEDGALLRRNVGVQVGAYTGEMYIPEPMRVIGDSTGQIVNMLDHLERSFGLYLPPEPAGAAEADAAAEEDMGVAPAAAGGGAGVA